MKAGPRTVRARQMAGWLERAQQVYVARACSAPWADIAAHFGVSVGMAQVLDQRAQQQVDRRWYGFEARQRARQDASKRPFVRVVSAPTEAVVAIASARATAAEREACARIAVELGAPRVAAAIRSRSRKVR